MFEFLTDPFAQFVIGVLIAVLAIIITIVIYYKQRNRKRLCYAILSSTAVLSSAEEVKNDIQLSYKGKAVEDVQLIVLRIFNSGNLPIISSDYEKPISIEFGKETRVLTAEVIKKKPKNLQSAISIEEHVVTLYPTLLNPGDSITIKMLVTKYDDALQINSRIIGVKQVEMLRERGFSTKAIIMLSVALLIWTVGSLAWSFIFRVSFVEVFSYFSAVFCGFLIVTLIGAMADKEYRRRFDRTFGDFFEESANK